MIDVMQLSALTEPLRGTLHRGDACFSRVSTDTRTLQSRDLYLALSGERFDGNEFVVQAREKGACGAIVSRDMEVDMPLLKVADTGQALAALALENRKRSAATVVAITGSQGKTTVKEMLGRILHCRHRTLVTRGNLNNHIGVPLTLLELEREHSRAVIELGASGPGEIAFTVDLARPDIAVLTNAAATHLEGFGSLEGVVRAKGEIIDGVVDGGVVVLNADDSAWPEWCRRATGRRVAGFSLRAANTEAEYRAHHIRSRAGRTVFTLVSPRGGQEIGLPLPGRHNIANALAAAAAALESGASLDDVRRGLESMQPVAGRLCPLPGRNGALLIDDSYNASPASFHAAIDVLRETAGMETASVLVVGEMAELGSQAEQAHREVAEYAKDCGIQHLWAVGRHGREMARVFGSGARHFPDMDALLDHASAVLDEKMTVLIKGSRSAGMDRAVEQLKAGESS